MLTHARPFGTHAPSSSCGTTSRGYFFSGFFGPSTGGSDLM